MPNKSYNAYLLFTSFILNVVTTIKLLITIQIFKNKTNYKTNTYVFVEKKACIISKTYKTYIMF